MFHACVQRFDGMDEKFFGRKLNRALEGEKKTRSCHHVRRHAHFVIKTGDTTSSTRMHSGTIGGLLASWWISLFLRKKG